MSKDIFQKILKRIDTYEKDIIDLQRLLTSIPALSPVNGGEGEKKKADAIKKYIEKMGFSEILEFKAPDSSAPCGYRPNMIAKFKGKSDKKTIWIMSHMDVVPPGDLNLWNSDPYEIKLEGNKIYGRGTEDNQQGIVSSIFALKALKDENILPEYDVGLVFVADEETGSEFGLSYVLDKYEGFRPEDYIIVPDYGSVNGSLIEIAEKSILWLQFTTLGKQCHASTPSLGINSFRAASHLVVALEELYEIYFDIDPLFVPPVSTFEPTKKEANVPNINTIPGKDVFCLDCRIMPSYNLDEVLNTVRKICNKIEEKFKVEIKIEPVQKEQAAPPTASDAPVVKALGDSIKSVMGVEPACTGIGGGTVAALFRKKGYSVAVWSRFDGMAHQPNEYCFMDNIKSDAGVFAHLMLQE